MIPEPEEALFAVEGDDVSALLTGLQHLRSHIDGKAGEMDALARGWWKMTDASRRRASERAVALVARDREELVRLIPGSRLAVLDRGGHNGLIETPEAVAGAILDFLNGREKLQEYDVFSLLHYGE